jgi:S-adenosylmethionine-diacylglycerol 3-amino-3-carboxypropyl transferase
MTAITADSELSSADALKAAVHQHRAISLNGMLERLFTMAFGGLVYPQIWEDPVVDLAAMELGENHRVITIASGGCNALSYMTASPERLIAVDLNPAHIALTRLKLAAACHLPVYEQFRRFFADADSHANTAAYRAFLRPHLDADTQRYWDKKRVNGRPRIDMFAKRFYRHGLLGRFIGVAHLVARMYGVRPETIINMADLAEQRIFFDDHIAPIFDKRLVRWLTGRKLSLYGLGIPPAQYEKLAGGRTMSEVLIERLRKLACDFPLNENYFAWQAFARRYDTGETAALPPYLQREHFSAIKRGAERITPFLGSFTACLKAHPAESLDRYVLLDAQDWMNDDQLNELWGEITRTARPDARVIFRTAGEATILPGRVKTETLDRWTYDGERSRILGFMDRSAIYGGFHLYQLKAPA